MGLRTRRHGGPSPEVGPAAWRPGPWSPAGWSDPVGGPLTVDARLARVGELARGDEAPMAPASPHAA